MPFGYLACRVQHVAAPVVSLRGLRQSMGMCTVQIFRIPGDGWKLATRIPTAGSL